MKDKTVEDVLAGIAKRIGRRAEDTEPYAEILRQHWYDDLESLSTLSREDLQAIGIPLRIAKELAASGVLANVASSDVPALPEPHADRRGGHKMGKGKSKRSMKGNSGKGKDHENGCKGKASASRSSPNRGSLSADEDFVDTVSEEAEDYMGNNEREAKREFGRFSRGKRKRLRRGRERQDHGSRSQDDDNRDSRKQKMNSKGRLGKGSKGKGNWDRDRDSRRPWLHGNGEEGPPRKRRR